VVGMTSECAWRQCVNGAHAKSGRHKSVTCFFIPAAHDKINHFLSIEGTFPVHDTQGSESPVDRIQAQMSGHMIDKIIFILFSLQSKCEEIEICLWRTDISQRLDVRHMLVHEQS